MIILYFSIIIDIFIPLSLVAAVPRWFNRSYEKKNVAVCCHPKWIIAFCSTGKSRNNCQENLSIWGFLRLVNISTIIHFHFLQLFTCAARIETTLRSSHSFLSNNWSMVLNKLLIFWLAVDLNLVPFKHKATALAEVNPSIPIQWQEKCNQRELNNNGDWMKKSEVLTKLWTSEWKLEYQSKGSRKWMRNVNIFSTAARSYCRLTNIFLWCQQ